MADFRKTPPRVAVSGGLTVPMDWWKQEVAAALDRTANLRHGASPTPATARSSDNRSAVDELALAFEELAVAEEELRVQNETLSLAYATIEADRERYRELFHQAPVPYLVTDAYGTIRDANSAAAAMLHARPDRLVGKPLVVFTRDVSRRRLRRVLAELQYGGEVATTTLKVTPRDGTTIRTRVTATSARDAQGTLIEVRWLIVDRTPQLDRARARRQHAEELESLVAQRTAELQRAQVLKDQLVANVSHEFRTALAAIGGYSELLTIGVRGQLTDAQLADVSRIHTAYEHLAKVVNDLLHYSRLTAGGETIDLDDISLDDALRGIGDLIRPQAGRKLIALHVIGSDQPAIVHANAERVRQIVLNLLGNAVKFTGDNGNVTLAWRSAERDAVIEVEDSGPGIPPEKREAIFEPFVRLKSDSSASGSGLGLAIARDMARAMKGDLTVREGRGGGSCFVLRLPLSARGALHHQVGA